VPQCPIAGYNDLTPLTFDLYRSLKLSALPTAIIIIRNIWIIE